MKKTLLTLLLLFTLLCGTAQAGTITGRVLTVVDGDTIKLNKLTVRLYGIDAPEKDQTYGISSKHALSRFIKNNKITIDVTGTDRYGRIIGKVYCDDTYINLSMIMFGHAWWYRKYAKYDFDLRDAEKDARTKKKGLWRWSNPEPPWEWRKSKR